MRVAVIAVMAGGLALAVAGCGSAPATSAATSVAAPTPTAAPPTPTPSPTVDPIAAAAQFYLNSANVFNAAENKVAKEEAPSQAYTKLVPDEKQSLAALEAWQNTIYTYSWPTSVQSQITALVAATQGNIQATEVFIADPDATTWNAETTPSNASNDAAAAVRLALHLPPLAQ